MKNGILVVDVARCHGCNNCFMACKDEFVGNDFPPYSIAQPRHGQRWINVKKRERGVYPMMDVAYLPTTCQHCENAACARVGGAAVTKSANGQAVLLHTVAAKGNRLLAEACPYHAVFWNEEAQLAQKCNLCSHLLDNGWDKPRCVMACPTGALTFQFVEEEDMKRFVAEHELSALRPELNTRPHVLYKNLYRFNRNFIGGAVTKNGDCLQNASVACRKEGADEEKHVTTNTFGEFKIDGLEDGDYLIAVSYLEGKVLSLTAKVDGASVYLGEIPYEYD